MPEKVNVLLPSITFFSAGRIAEGAANLALQASLIGWPLAVHWARQFHEARYVNGMLKKFADAYPVPMQRAKQGKRFRATVFADQIVFGNRHGTLRRAA